MHFSSKPTEFWNDPKRSDVSLFWMKRQSHCPKQAYNCSNYNVSVSAGLKDNTVIIFYLYTIQVTTFTITSLSRLFLDGLWSKLTLHFFRWIFTNFLQSHKFHLHRFSNLAKEIIAVKFDLYTTNTACNFFVKCTCTKLSLSVTELLLWGMV